MWLRAAVAAGEAPFYLGLAQVLLGILVLRGHRSVFL
jgi:hypothetical protein